MITLDFPKSFCGNAPVNRRTSVGQSIDNINPFIIHNHLIISKLGVRAITRFITADTNKLKKIIHFMLYFLQSSPFTTCPIPYAKKKNEGTIPASAFDI